MSLALFHVTLFVLLASIMTSAICVSAYLVSRKRLMLFLASAFLFYFFDIAFIFQDEFVHYVLQATSDSEYLLIRSYISIFTGLGLLMSFWLLVCDFLGEHRRVILLVPGILFVVSSVVMLIAIPEGSVQRFCFYTMRMVFAAWMLIFASLHYVASKDEVEKGRMRRHRWLILGVFLLGAAVVAEDVVFFLVYDSVSLNVGLLELFAERNYSEELLMLFIAVFACRDAYQVLSLRFEKPPMHGNERQEQRIRENLMSYAKSYKLTERESEVLYLVLMGKDNQNIASAMQLALSTVKVHVHNILQKTGHSNRQELIRDFWKTS